MAASGGQGGERRAHAGTTRRMRTATAGGTAVQWVAATVTAVVGCRGEKGEHGRETAAEMAPHAAITAAKAPPAAGVQW